jgi:hypothetical protein
MHRQSSVPSDVIRAIQSDCFATAHMLQRQEWQQNAVALAEQKRMLNAAGPTNEEGVVVPSFRRVRAGLGGALVRLGSRRQSAGTPIAHPAR